MNHTDIWNNINDELRKDKREYTNYPEHIMAQVGMIGKELGLLTQAAYSSKYDKLKDINSYYHDMEIRKTAIKTAVAAIRFLENIK
jgi:hypothetical protein